MSYLGPEICHNSIGTDKMIHEHVSMLHFFYGKKQAASSTVRSVISVCAVFHPDSCIWIENLKPWFPGEKYIFLFICLFVF